MSDKYEEFFGKLHEILVGQTKDNSSQTISENESLYGFSEDANFRDFVNNTLNVIGGSFAVLEVGSSYPLLLSNKNILQGTEISSSDYIWFSYESKHFDKNDAIRIDDLFLRTRKSQKFSDEAPDFLNRDQSEILQPIFFSLPNNKFRGFQLRYCDNSEIIIFILLYLDILETLSESRKQIVNTLSDLENDTIKTLFDEFAGIDSFSLNYEKLFQKLKLLKKNEPTKALYDLMNRLGFSESENDSPIVQIRQKIREIIELLNLNSDDPINSLHKKSRFPIIPYIEIMLKHKEDNGIGHLVFPVWRSYEFAPKVKFPESDEGEHVYEVIYALLTVNDDHYRFNFNKNFIDLWRFIKHTGEITADKVFYNKFTYKRIKREAFKAAISHVLLRNNAHNLGSHVSYRATNTQIKKRAREFEGVNLEETVDRNSDKINSPKFTDWLDYFSDKLDKYEIHRNEYLSDMNLSPKSVKFYADVILPFCENTFLMDNIAAGEQLNYITNEDETDGNNKITRNRLSVKCCIEGKEIWAVYPKLKPMFGDEKTKIRYPDKFPYLLDKTKDANTFADAMNAKEFFGGEDVEICIHSEQAVYSILENFIRNSAKHGCKTDELIIHLDLRKGDGFYELYIYDNDRSMADKGKLERILDSIDQDLVDEQGTPRKENWGLADMKINSYLLYHNFETIESSNLTQNFKLVVKKEKSDDRFPDFISVTKKEDLDILEQSEKTEMYSFGYKLNLSIPKQILWIGDSDENLKSLKLHGLEIVKTFEKLKNALEERKGLSSFQFAIINSKNFDQAEYDKYLQFYQEQLPGRVIVLNGDESLPVKPSVLITKNDLPSEAKQDVSKMLKWCWQKWLMRVGKDINLYLYFENDNVAEKWSEKFELGNNLKLEIINNLTEHSINKEKYNVFYDHHGEGFSKERDQRKCLTPAGYKRANFAIENSIICFGGGSEDFSSLNYPPSKTEEKEQILFQRADAATTNIFIIDERISAAATNKISNKFKNPGRTIGSDDFQGFNCVMYAAGKVFVVNEIINKMGEGFFIGSKKGDDEKLTLDISGEKMKFTSKITQLKEIDEIRKDILIIHRTYLDEKRIGITPETFLADASKIFGSVFITSGGGYPHNLKGKWRFVSFSTLEACVNSQLAKNRLNNILRTNLK